MAQQRYSVEIRNDQGVVLARGTGRTDWQQTATRLAAHVGQCGHRDELVDTYFPTNNGGAPWGTHHVQWGYRPRSESGLSLGPTYIVNVQPA